MAILSKGCKPDNFESHNSLKLSVTNIRGLRSNFVDCESFLVSFLDDSSDFSNFSVKGYLLLIQKNLTTHAWSRSLCEGRASFCTGLISRKLCRLLLMFLTGFT